MDTFNNLIKVFQKPAASLCLVDSVDTSEGRAGAMQMY